MRISTELWQNIRRVDTKIRNLGIERHTLDLQYQVQNPDIITMRKLEIEKKQEEVDHELHQLFNELNDECSYFAYLIHIGEISDWRLLSYYLPQILDKAKYSRDQYPEHNKGSTTDNIPIEKLLEAEKRIPVGDVKNLSSHLEILRFMNSPCSLCFILCNPRSEQPEMILFLLI